MNVDDIEDLILIVDAVLASQADGDIELPEPAMFFDTGIVLQESGRFQDVVRNVARQVVEELLPERSQNTARVQRFLEEVGTGDIFLDACSDTEPVVFDAVYTVFGKYEEEVEAQESRRSRLSMTEINRLEEIRRDLLAML